MNIEDIKNKIEQSIEQSTAVVDSVDDAHFYITVVSDTFEKLSKIKQHKMVMGLFQDELSSGEVHALSVKTFTRDKWAALRC